MNKIENNQKENLIRVFFSLKVKWKELNDHISCAIYQNVGLLNPRGENVCNVFKLQLDYLRQKKKRERKKMHRTQTYTQT